MSRAILPIVLALGGSAACHTGPPEAATDPAGPVVKVEEGRLVGKWTGQGAAAFLGVPFAAPPVGARRWAPPAAPAGWDGSRPATTFAPACPQDDATAVYYRRAARRLGTDTSAIPELGPTSEDCLYLNVWTPALHPARPLPVFVWVHGGAGTTGYTADPLFDGATLATAGMVVVTVTYRLGALGFLAHPALTADSPHGTSGNYALMDLVRALEWVRANAGAFGGDAGRVTLAGQSAGASLAQLLLVSPAAEGLFHRLVAHSGDAVGRRADLPTAETAGARFMAALGLSPDADAAALRRIPADSLVAAARRTGPDVPAHAVVDGRLLPAQPPVLFRAGHYHRMPILAGSVNDEMSLLVPPDPVPRTEYLEWVEGTRGGDADAVLALYPPSDDGAANLRQALRLMGDRLFAAPHLLLLEWTEGRSPLYLYRFDWAPDDAVGAFHGVDLPFLFGTHGLWWSATPEVMALAREMRGAWVRFAAHGEPEGGDLDPWPAATVADPRAMVFDLDPSLRPLPRLEAVRLFAERMDGRR